MSAARICVRCGIPGGKNQSGFRPTKFRKDGLRAECRACAKELEAERRSRWTEEEKQEAYRKQRERRQQRSREREQEFDASVANDGQTTPQATAQRVQYYSDRMADVAMDLLETGELSDESRAYVGELTEAERRAGNRRTARSISLAVAHNNLFIRDFMEAATKYFDGRITPTGYANTTPTHPKSRTLVAPMNDFHLGADMRVEEGEPESCKFGPVEEARRLEHIVYNHILTWKPQYKANTDLLWVLNGDLVEGYLQKDYRSGAPLAEQASIFWHYMGIVAGEFAARFPRVHVVCQPGNHGRNIARHPGRPSAFKWDSFERILYTGLQAQCSQLKNMTWDIPLTPVSIVDVYGAKFLIAHGDTEPRLGDPDTKAKDNFSAISELNNSLLYGHPIDVAMFAHFHKGRYQPRLRTEVIFNGPLIPPGGYARMKGFVGERCGWFLFEATKGHPVGDLRFVEVGPTQDVDETLGQNITPFRYEMP